MYERETVFPALVLLFVILKKLNIVIEHCFGTERVSFQRSPFSLGQRPDHKSGNTVAGSLQSGERIPGNRQVPWLDRLSGQVAYHLVVPS